MSKKKEKEQEEEEAETRMREFLRLCEHDARGRLEGGRKRWGGCSRCERELPAPGWRIHDAAVMGQLVSYRGSSVSGRRGPALVRVTSPR